MFEERDKAGGTCQLCTKQAIFVTICCDMYNILMRRTMEINYSVSLPERGESKINTGCF
jgi:hypothetical protein